LISFFFTLVGLDPNSSLKVTRGSISFRNSSVFGSSQISAPLPNISAFLGGYKKPFFALVFAVLFGISGLVSLIESIEIFIVMIVLSGICLLYYYLAKTMFIGFETNGGGTHGFAFRASIIEGVGVNIQRVEDTIAYVNSLISSAALGEVIQETTNPVIMGNRTATVRSEPQKQYPEAALPQPAPPVAALPQPAPPVAAPPQPAVPQQGAEQGTPWNQ
jgi:hypothetical protein